MADTLLDEAQLSNCLYRLSLILNKVTGKETIILVDEYDKPSIASSVEVEEEYGAEVRHISL